MVRLVSTNLLLLLLHLHLLLHLVQGADISLDAICGNKLVRIKPPSLSLSLSLDHEQVDSCPKKISLKVIGGTSSCAEKVPWNVLVEHATSTNKAAGYKLGLLLKNTKISKKFERKYKNTATG